MNTLHNSDRRQLLKLALAAPVLAASATPALAAPERSGNRLASSPT